MTSRAEGKRKKKAANVIRQRQGRPRKEGAVRWECGKIRLAPVAPNPDTVKWRAEVLGINPETATRAELAAAENPMSVAQFRGWLTETDVKAGEEIAAQYRKAGLDLPGIRTQDFARVAKGYSETVGNPVAFTRILGCIEAMRLFPKAHAAVFAFCVLNEWPVWMVERLNNNPHGEHNVGYTHLRTGLRIAAKELGVSAGRMERAA